MARIETNVSYSICISSRLYNVCLLAVYEPLMKIPGVLSGIFLCIFQLLHVYLLCFSLFSENEIKREERFCVATIYVLYVSK